MNNKNKIKLLATSQLNNKSVETKITIEKPTNMTIREALLIAYNTVDMEINMYGLNDCVESTEVLIHDF